MAVALTAAAFGLYARGTARWVVLGWIGLVPWLAVLDGARTLRAALALGVVMAVAFELAVFGWFARSIAEYAGLPAGVALATLGLAAPLLQLQLVTFAAARHLARARGAATGRAALAAGCVYVATEWATGKLFADTLGHGLYGSLWMRQAADLAGAAGLTLVLLVANEHVLAATAALAAAGPPLGRVRRALRPGLVAAGLALALLLYGAARCRELAGAGGTPLTAAVVQADVSHYDRLAAEVGTYAAVRAILDAHVALSATALARAPLDLLIWPETVYPTTFGKPKSAEGAAFDREITTFVARTGVPLVFGAYDAEDGREFNAAFFLAPPARGRAAAVPGLDVYRKAWLFPLTERVPRWLDSAWLRRRLPWLGTWQPGPGPRVVPVTLPDGRTVRIAPLICYDALAPRHALAEVRAGADLIVTLSNDSWLHDEAGRGPGPMQHLLGAAFLSIETRRPQLRATPTGISAVIGPAGELIAHAGVHERAALVGAVVPEGRRTTLRVRWGDWLGPVAAGVALVLLGRRRG